MAFLECFISSKKYDLGYFLTNIKWNFVKKEPNKFHREILFLINVIWISIVALKDPWCNSKVAKVNYHKADHNWVRLQRLSFFYLSTIVLDCNKVNKSRIFKLKWFFFLLNSWNCYKTQPPVQKTFDTIKCKNCDLWLKRHKVKEK